MKTKKQVIDFLESKLGTKVPCKGNSSLDGQCVTLIKALMEFLGVPDPYKARGHGKDCIAAYLKEGIADKGAGFISVFSNKNMGGGYGHVWCNAGDGAGTYYESNGAKPLTTTKGKTYTYDAVCNFDKYISEKGVTVSNPDAYGDMVWKSTQYDETVKSLFEAGRDPRQTESKDVLAVVNGYKSQATDSRNKLATAEQEVKNKTQQVSRLEQQLVEDSQLCEVRITALKTDTKSIEKLEQTYLGQIEVLKKRVDELAKEKGRILIEKATLEAENKELKERSLSPLRLGDVLAQVLPKIISGVQKLFERKYEQIRSV